MASTLQNSTVLFSRLLSLKENSPFLLCIDSLSQSSFNLQLELIHKLPKQTKVIYLSFETLEKPEYATQFIECLGMNPSSISSIIRQQSSSESPLEKRLILVDSLNYIDATQLSSFISSLFSPSTTIFATYHSSIPADVRPENPNYPHALQLLQFIASTIFEIYPILLGDNDEEYLESSILRLNFPINQCHNKTFKLILNNRRKSGRSLIYHLKVNATLHSCEIYKEENSNKDELSINTEEELMRNLTTFNLSTSSKQKLAREQVELPFLEAQSFGSGGAIVYEFEKDDDYDEDDPYEDPF